MNEQPEALRLAEQLEHCINNAEDVTLSYFMYWHWSAKDAAAELRRLTEVNQELVEALEELLCQTRQYGHKPEIKMAEAALRKARGATE